MCQHCPGKAIRLGGGMEVIERLGWSPLPQNPSACITGEQFHSFSSRQANTTRLNELSLCFLVFSDSCSRCLLHQGLCFSNIPVPGGCCKCSNVRGAGSLLFAEISAVKLKCPHSLFSQWHEESWRYSGGPSKEDCQQYQSSRNSHKEQPCSCVRYQNDVAQERKKEGKSCIAGQKWWLINGRIWRSSLQQLWKRNGWDFKPTRHSNTEYKCLKNRSKLVFYLLILKGGCSWLTVNTDSKYQKKKKKVKNPSK